MKKTQFKAEDIFGKILSEKTLFHLSKQRNFFGGKNVKINIKNIFKFFKPRKNKIIDIEPSAPTYYE